MTYDFVNKTMTIANTELSTNFNKPINLIMEDDMVLKPGKS